GGHERFVDVDDVEVALREPPLRDARDPGAEREPSDRPVVVHRERPPNRADVLRQRLLGIGWGEHGDAVAPSATELSEIPHVELHTAGSLEGVRADDPYSHGPSPKAPLEARARRVSSRSATKHFCNICQSCG